MVDSLVSPEPMDSAGAKLFSLADLIPALEADADRRNLARKEGRKLGPVTGLTKLDEMLGGYLAPGVHVTHGDPGTGKTALALQIAASCGFPALYVSAEMPMIELARRITARITKTFLGRLKSGEMNASHASDLAKRAFSQCPGLYLLDATAGPAPVEHLASCVQMIKQKEEASQMLVVVDSAHSWAAGFRSDTQSEYDGLTSALTDLRTLASLMEGPVIAIAERNRASRKQAGMDAAAGTRSFEYGAETVISLEVKEDESAPSPDEKRVNAHIQKNRHDASGVYAKLAFHGALQQYQEVK